MLFIVILFPRNSVRCETSGKEMLTFGSVTGVGNNLYIPTNKTKIPSDLTYPTNYDPSDNLFVLRAIDFSDPMNPVIINDMDMGAYLVNVPQYYRVISGDYLYSFTGESFTGENQMTTYDLEDYPNGITMGANFSVFQNQNDEMLKTLKTINLADILDSMRIDQNEMFQAQAITVTDNHAYLIFNGIIPSPSDWYIPYFSYSTPDIDDSYTPYPTTYSSYESYPIPDMDDPYPSYAPPDHAYPADIASSADINTITSTTSTGTGTGTSTYSSNIATTSYPGSDSPFPKNNTVIVTIDITNPNNANVLGATRLEVASTGANMSLVVSNTTGYLLAPIATGTESTIYVLDMTSPNNIKEINSLNTYGGGGCLVKKGNYLYMSGQGFGLEIIDVSNSHAPLLKSWLETENPLSGNYMSIMGGENNIVIQNNYVYLLDRKDGLIVIDVSDPGNPYQVSSFISKYVSNSSDRWWYAAYNSVNIYDDYLFLNETSNIEIISIKNPLSPVLIGMFGEKMPATLTVTLKLEAAELLNFNTDQKLFGISSLDALNNKYNVFHIDQHNSYSPYYRSGYSYYPLPFEEYEYRHEYTIDEIKKDRNLRMFFLEFPGDVDIDEIIKNYKSNPYVLAIEAGIGSDMYGGYSSYGYSSSYGGASPYEGAYAMTAPIGIPQTYEYSQGQVGEYASTYGSVNSDMSLDTTPPLNVTDFSTTAGDQTITLSWTPSTNSAGDLFTQLLYIDSGSGYGDPIYLGKERVSYEITDLTNGMNYNIKLTVIDSKYNESDGVTAAAIPQAPARTQTTSFSSFSQWNLPTTSIFNNSRTWGNLWNNQLNSGWDNIFNQTESTSSFNIFTNNLK